jgi:hypothetical protein
MKELPDPIIDRIVARLRDHFQQTGLDGWLDE